MSEVADPIPPHPAPGASPRPKRACPMERQPPLCQSKAMPSRFTLRAVLAASLCLGSAAHAAGFYFPDLGPKQLGRGGTGVAGPGDLAALTYNPAGLALLPEQGRLFLQLGASESKQPVSYTRAGGCGTSQRPCGEVNDSAGWYPNTLSGAAIDLGLAHPALSGWVFAVGVHGPSALGSHTYPDPRLAGSAADVSATAPQRYSLISSENLILYPAFALATRLTPWLDAGLSLEPALLPHQADAVDLRDRRAGRGPPGLRRHRPPSTPCRRWRPCWARV